MNIMIVGGGSGGHITPLLAVATSLKSAHKVRVSVVGQKGENLSEVIDHEAIDQVFSIRAGKFRRYHGESFLSHLFDIRTILLNFRDFFRFVVGTAQAWMLLGKERPDSIMLKGGFVSVPVGFAARLRKIPYITHDSDAVPGLANRLTAKHAAYNTTAMSADIYPYDQTKTVEVGIPLRQEYEFVSDKDQAHFKSVLQIDPKEPVLFCAGGGLGAQKLNVAMSNIAKELLTKYPKLEIIHISGKKLLAETKDLYHLHLSEDLFNRVRVIDFHTELYKLSGAADIIVSRAGATAIAEYAVQAKACILVPNPVLTGGQQTHNARIIKEAGAAVIANEGDNAALLREITELLDSKSKQRELSEKLHALANEESAKKIADILVEIARRER